MNTARLMGLYYTLAHGWTGFAFAYGVTALFSLAGLKRAHVRAGHYLIWPFTSLITLCAVGFTLFLVWLISGALHIQYSMPVQSLISVVLMMLGGLLGGLFWGSRGAALGPLHTRGAMVVDEPSAQHRGGRIAKFLRRDEAVKVAGIALDYEDETKHFKFMGTTGSGKSTAMRELIDGALRRGDRAVIADPDGAFLSRFYDRGRGDVILNPFDARSVKWDLFAEIEKPYDIDQLARAMIPDKNGGDNSWPSYARTFFGAVMRQAQALRLGNAQELYRLLTTAKREELQVLIEGTPASPFLDQGNERFFGSVRSTTADYTRSLEYICAQRGAPFSVRQWIRSGKGVLFLPYQADQIAALKTMISTWMRLAIFQTLSLGEADHRIWFAVDELDALGPIDGLSDALPRLRKFGGRCALGFQSISQVSNTYGQGLAQAMVENCGTSLVLRCSSSENGGTSRFASRLIGDREVLRVANSVNRSSSGFMGTSHESRGLSEHHATEPAVMPAEIEQLADRSGFLKFPSQAAWIRVSFPYFDVPKVAEPFVAT